MMLEVQNGTVHNRNSAICQSRLRTWNARKYETVKPIASVIAQTISAYFDGLQVQRQRVLRGEQLGVIAELKRGHAADPVEFEEAHAHDHQQRNAEEQPGAPAAAERPADRRRRCRAVCMASSSCSVRATRTDAAHPRRLVIRQASRGQELIPALDQVDDFLSSACSSRRHGPCDSRTSRHRVPRRVSPSSRRTDP